MHTFSATSGRRSAAQWMTQSGANADIKLSIFEESVKSTASSSEVGRECASPFTAIHHPLMRAAEYF